MNRSAITIDQMVKYFVLGIQKLKVANLENTAELICSKSTYLYITDSQETVMCQHGVHVENDSGDVVFEYADSRQCRVHNQCVTVTLSATQNDMGEKRKYYKFISS